MLSPQGILTSLPYQAGISRRDLPLDLRGGSRFWFWISISTRLCGGGSTPERLPAIQYVADLSGQCLERERLLQESDLGGQNASANHCVVGVTAVE